MIKITPHLVLNEIDIQDQPNLLRLMHQVYPQTYAHLWQDQGTNYINTVYGLENFQQELQDPNSLYCFVVYDETIVGILRLLDNASLVDLPNEPATKLHRIYIDNNVKGKGIGKALIDWTTQRAAKQGHTIVWLEAMDTQEAAIGFYEKQGFSISGKDRLELDLLYPHLRGMYRMWKHAIKMI
ncbi:GNAT family N-acetyltransferase [uncultured Microscilla sp.]|uniref:GNAT family N-acetyltransferase n=1 Tax=uncultured Microscilla sp. TaxID=432653 RepID=UPI0026314033|nr:GNAT family N-acetyltransferase [uncultured Microscilla sp.]